MTKDKAIESFKEYNERNSTTIPAIILIALYDYDDGLIDIIVSGYDLTDSDGELTYGEFIGLIYYEKSRDVDDVFCELGINEITVDNTHGYKAINDKLCTGFKSIEKANVFYIKIIASHTFRGCVNLTEVVNIDKVCEIQDYAFMGCTSLKEITLGEQITYIGDDAFADCPNLTIYVYPNTYAERYCKENSLKHKYIEIFAGKLYTFTEILVLIKKVDRAKICYDGNKQFYCRKGNVDRSFVDVKTVNERKWSIELNY